MYISEAHTTDGWQLESNEQAGIFISQHTSLEERLSCARRCEKDLALTIPTVVDTISNDAFEAFSAWPERIYIITPDSRIHYKGGPGPFEFNVEEARASLLELLET